MRHIKRTNFAVIVGRPNPTNHSDAVEEVVDLFLRDLIVSDRSRATIKTYAFVLRSWLNFP